ALVPGPGRPPPPPPPGPQGQEQRVKALLFERSVPKVAASRLAGSLVPGLGARFGPLRLTSLDEPEPPGPEWVRVRPRLAGYCADTGGGWSTAFVAHRSQLHPVPDSLSDQDAVMVEPTACAIHGALRVPTEGALIVVIGAGTLGLCTVAALRRLGLPGTLVVVAKHPEQRRLATELGADLVVEPQGARRAVRLQTRSLAVDGRLTGGADVVIDCVGSARSLADALAVVRPRGQVVLLGMPEPFRTDLTPLWHREVALVGAFAYGSAPPAAGRARARTFALAFELVADAGLGRLVSATYPLERYREAVEHAASAGRQGG